MKVLKSKSSERCPLLWQCHGKGHDAHFPSQLTSPTQPPLNQGVHHIVTTSLWPGNADLPEIENLFPCRVSDLPSLGMFRIEYGDDEINQTQNIGTFILSLGIILCMFLI